MRIAIANFFSDRGEEEIVNYVNVVCKAGQKACPIAYTESVEEMARQLSEVGLLILPGGAEDVAPRLYGEKPIESLGPVIEARDRFEMSLFREALRMSIPVLGICRGLQVINVCEGGSLWQDLPSQCQLPPSNHQRPDARWEGVHTIAVEEDSWLQTLIGKREAWVNSTHHQEHTNQGQNTSGNTQRAIVDAQKSEIRQPAD